MHISFQCIQLLLKFFLFLFLSQEVLRYYEIYRAEFPNAKIKASTFDDYITALWPIKDQLPVITKEIGDTWIMGIASDPRKSAEYRAVSRVLGSCVRQGQFFKLLPMCTLLPFIYIFCHPLYWKGLPP